jgi:hypothetical protein
VLVGERVAEDHLAVLGEDAHRRLDGERRDDLRLAARGHAVVAGRILEDRALHVLVAVLGIGALALLARGRGGRLGDRLAQVLGLQPEALLDGAEVLRLHRRVAVRDGVEDGLEPVLQLARGRVGGHGLDRLLDVEDDVVEVAPRRRLDVHLAEADLLERVARRRNGAVGARGGEHLLVGLGDVANAVATAQLAQSPAVVLDHQLGDLIEPEPLVREEAHHVEDGDAPVLGALVPEPLDGAAHLDRVLPVVFALGRSLCLRGAGCRHVAHDRERDARGGDEQRRLGLDVEACQEVRVLDAVETGERGAHAVRAVALAVPLVADGADHLDDAGDVVDGVDVDRVGLRALAHLRLEGLEPGLEPLAALALERGGRQREPELGAVAAHHQARAHEPFGFAPRDGLVRSGHRQRELGVGAGGVLRAHRVEVDDRGGDDLDVLATGAGLERTHDVRGRVEEAARARLDADVDVACRVRAHALTDEGLLVVEEADADDAARRADDAHLRDAVRAVGEPAPGAADGALAGGRARSCGSSAHPELGRGHAQHLGVELPTLEVVAAQERHLPVDEVEERCVDLLGVRGA